MARHQSSCDFYTSFLYSPAQKPRLWRCPPSTRSLQRGNRSVRVYVYALMWFWGINSFMLLVFGFFFCRKKSSATEPKAKKARTVKKGKDPNKPKRPPTAFFLFMYGLPISLFHTWVLLFVLFYCFVWCVCWEDVSYVRFRDDFRKEFKEAHPGNKDVKMVQIFGVLLYFIW